MEAKGNPGLALADREGPDGGPSDHQLVSAVRRGDERAFELLYGRYQRRIGAYVLGMVKDHGRAEDITQEVFVAALRRMRQTERPIAFKPWIYEIAKNACIDAYRRGRRAEEVSFDADDGLSAADHGKLVDASAEPDIAVDAKQELDRLCGAFGGLSETHHRILVLRELEGRSYKDIGEQLGMSRPSVESTLFRARRRLGEEYDDLASGARCVRIQAIVHGAGGTRLGVRDAARLARHVSHCQPCRRLAVRAGLDVPVPGRRGIAAWLPLPGFLRPRRGGDDAASVAGGWLFHGPALADQFQSGWGKAVAGVAALLIAGAGVGAGTGALEARDDQPRRVPASATAPTAPDAGATARAGTRAGDAGAGAEASGVSRARGTTATTGTRRGGAAVRDGGAAPARGGGEGPQPGPAPAGDPGTGGAARAGSDPLDPATRPKVKVPALPKVPSVDVPVQGGGAVQEAAQNVDDTVDGAVDNVQDTVDDAAQNAQQVVTDPANAVPNAGKTVDDALDDAGKTAGDAVAGAGDAADGLINP